MQKKPIISLGQILDQTWDIYTENFLSHVKSTLPLFIIPFLTLIPTVLFGLIDNLYVLSGISILLTLIIIPLIGAFVYANLIEWNEYIDKKKEIKNPALLISPKQFLEYLGVSVLRAITFIASLFIIVPSIALIIYGLTSEGSILPMLALAFYLLSIVGTFVVLALLFTYLSFTAFSAILSKRGIIQSFKHSIELVRGRFWSVLAKLLIPKFLFSLLSTLIAVVITLGLSLLFSVLPELVSLLGVNVIGIIYDITGITAMAITLPLFVTSDYLIFKDLEQNNK